MRLDKFLKVSRMIKRRTVAKEVTDSGRVLVNGRKAKASTTVEPGNEITIKFGQKTIVARVEVTKEASRKEEAGMMYTLLREEVHPANDDLFPKRD